MSYRAIGVPETQVYAQHLVEEGMVAHTDNVTVPAVLEQPMEAHHWVEPLVVREHTKLHHDSSHNPNAPHERTSRLNFCRRGTKRYYRDPYGLVYSWVENRDGTFSKYTIHPQA